MNLCRKCGQDFGSVSAFDLHRIGKHDYLWSLENEDGRRCLSAEEMRARGMRKDQQGRWRGKGPIREIRVTLEKASKPQTHPSLWSASRRASTSVRVGEDA